MDVFDPVDFCENPSVPKLLNKSIKKDQWKFIATYFKIEFTSEMTKEVIKNSVLETLVNKELLDYSAVEQLTPMSFTPKPDKVRPDELIADSEVNESNQSSKDEEIVESNAWNSARLDFETQKLKLQLEAQEKIEARRIALEHLKLDREYEIEKRKLDQLESFETTRVNASKTFNLKENVKIVPLFDETDPDGYFLNFERTANHLKWPKTEWPWLLQSKLTGKAAHTFNNLSEISDYDYVKRSILDAYAITPDGYRQKFRNHLKSPLHTFVEFANEKLRMFKKWLQVTETKSYDQLVNLLAVEEFKRRIPLNILMHVEEKGETDLIKIAQLADSYALLVKSHSTKVKRTEFVKSSFTPNPDLQSGKPKEHEQRFCSYCKKSGHNISNCWNPKCKVSKSGSGDASQLGSNVTPVIPANKFKPVSNVSVVSPSEDLFIHFKSRGFISLSEHSKPHPILILRDTGASQSILYMPSLPGVESNGESTLLRDFSALPTLKLANVYLDSDLVKGNVKVALSAKLLPVEEVDFILGNDLAGRLVVPNVTVVEKPLLDSPTEELEKSQPFLFPTCAVTRSQANAKVVESIESNVTDMLPSQIMSKETLIESQKVDPTLANFRSLASDKNSVDKVPGFYFHEGLLMRVFRPPESRSTDTWSEVHQVVIPQSIRNDVISIAHDGLSGHLGINNTCRRLLASFYWPQIRKDVKAYVKSCHVCQMVGNPNQTIPVAPLKPIPVMSAPFEKIVIDCVGPLPKTKKGNIYLLTVMCTATRYPEVFPLRNIKAKNIVKCLLNFFTSVGIPKEIQSDQASNFSSDLFREVLKELNISQTLSSAYHPQSQGCLERFHQTLKTVLRKFCFETASDWDESISFLLFALRETPQESLGYSPFELLYGRQIRGPLKVLKDEWFKEPSTHSKVTVTQYLDRLKTTLKHVRDLALSNLQESQKRMKLRYDAKVVNRCFTPGDKVLLFLPIPGNPLKSKFTGPYVVSHKLSDTNYVIHTPNRRKDTQMVHINLIKPYLERVKGDSLISHVNCNIKAIVERDEAEDVINIPVPKLNPVNSDWLNNLFDNVSHLSKPQKIDIANLLKSFPEVTSDIPGKCTVMEHDIELLPTQLSPIRQSAYRVNPRKLDAMKAEVEYLLKNSLAEPSKSPWASPCLLVPKPDGSHRFCTDYRRINKVTISDSYPLPLIEDLIDRVGQSRFVTTIDLQKGYYQISLTEKARKISAFITPFGLYHYTVMPFGLCNAPATFQRIINYVIQGLIGIYAYIDDIVIISDTWEQHLSRVTELFQRLKDAGLTVNLAKSVFGSGTVVYLGHVVGQGKTRPKQANVEAILNFPTPTSRKSIMRFMGMTGFYRRFCPNFSAVAAPLTNLTSSKVPFVWTEECETAFSQLKGFLSAKPVLRTPDYDKPFILHIDASINGVGALLSQRDDSTTVLHPVSYFSSKLKPHQKSYSTIELETLSLVMSLRKFNCYLDGHPEMIQVYSDHNPLVFLSRMQNSNQRLMRWALQVQQYNLNIHHVRGSDNVVADALSRAPIEEPVI